MELLILYYFLKELQNRENLEKNCLSESPLDQKFKLFFF